MMLVSLSRCGGVTLLSIYRIYIRVDRRILSDIEVSPCMFINIVGLRVRPTAVELLGVLAKASDHVYIDRRLFTERYHAVVQCLINRTSK